MADYRKKALSAALSQIEKQFGKGSVMRMGDTTSLHDIQTIPTGSLGLDIALGVGGVPKGRVVEIYGPESSGKTTLTLHIVAQAQRQGGTAAFVDAEHALDQVYAEKLGVNIDELLVSQPDTGEQALEITDMLVRSGAVDVVVIDSVAALTPKAEIEGEMGDSHVGLQARLMSQALRKLTGNIKRSNCLVIFINQIRMKIGVMFGNPETTTGGNALKFYASVRMDIRKIATIKEGQEVVVQVAKDPIGTKGARVTGYLSLPGRFLVFLPDVDHVGVSRRIGDAPHRVGTLDIKQLLELGAHLGRACRSHIDRGISHHVLICAYFCASVKNLLTPVGHPKGTLNFECPRLRTGFIQSRDG